MFVCPGHNLQLLWSLLIGICHAHLLSVGIKRIKFHRILSQTVKVVCTINTFTDQLKHNLHQPYGDCYIPPLNIRCKERSQWDVVEMVIHTLSRSILALWSQHCWLWGFQEVCTTCWWSSFITAITSPVSKHLPLRKPPTPWHCLMQVLTWLIEKSPTEFKRCHLFLCSVIMSSFNYTLDSRSLMLTLAGQSCQILIKLNETLSMYCKINSEETK